MLKFTAYNCGTGYNRYSNDVVAELYRETTSPCMVTDGVGGGGPHGQAGGAWKVSGLLGGKGVDANVDDVVSEVERQFAGAHGGMILNMCGWSRGAITCIKIANVLHANRTTSAIPVNIFAVDPVPGGSSINNHMWQSLDMTPNIRVVSIVLSQHDRRSLFAPYYPPILGPFTEVNIMPGDHSTVVEAKPGRPEAYELVKDMAKRFLMARGTVFNSTVLLTPPEILKRYALIAEKFDDYAYFAKGAKKDWEKRFKKGRDIRDIDRDKVARMLPVKPQFFINEHHRVVFQDLFPNLTNEIDFPPERAFDVATHSKWQPEIDRMMAADMVEQARMVLLYSLACESRHASHGIGMSPSAAAAAYRD
ncbi:MAG TPA: hypothetical protein VL523_11240 [Terriglobia bacterium]|nr:hypothetical protein [Terriglobia bacterium]